MHFRPEECECKSSFSYPIVSPPCKNTVKGESIQWWGLERASEKKHWLETMWRGEVDHVLRLSNWSITLIEGMIEGRSGTESPRYEYMDGEQKQQYMWWLPTKGKKFQNHQPLGWWEEEDSEYIYHTCYR